MRIDADYAVKPDGQNSVISFLISKWLLPESLVFWPLVEGNEDSGNEIEWFIEKLPQCIKFLLRCSVMILLLAPSFSIRPITKSDSYDRVVQLKHVKKATLRFVHFGKLSLNFSFRRLKSALLNHYFRVFFNLTVILYVAKITQHTLTELL